MVLSRARPREVPATLHPGCGPSEGDAAKYPQGTGGKVPINGVVQSAPDDETKSLLWGIWAAVKEF
jgi:hypothetical protein